MITATNARINATSSANVETEIALINLNILSSIQAGQVVATVTKNTVSTVHGTAITGTPITQNEDYYKVWQNTNVGNISVSTQNLYNAEMTTVINTFTNLGYTISRRTMDAQYLYWYISW
jgi:hypothetical protein